VTPTPTTPLPATAGEDKCMELIDHETMVAEHGKALAPAPAGGKP
jgi:hypothetical protein